MRRAEVVRELRRQASFLDKKIAETVVGTAKWHSLRQSFIAIDIAAREIDAVSLRRKAAIGVLKLSLPDTPNAQFLRAWADAVLAEHARAKALLRAAAVESDEGESDEGDVGEEEMS